MNHARPSLFFVVVLLSGLLLCGTASAKGKTGTFGFGINTDVSTLFFEGDSTLALSSILIPIQASESFRIEPEIGFNFDSSTRDFENSSSETSALKIKAGLGFLFTNSVTKKGIVMFGARLGTVMASTEVTSSGSESDSTRETSRTGFYGSFVSGGEFFFSSSVSIGGELQISVVSQGDIEVSGDGADDETEESDLTIGTSGMLTLRWYFM